MSGLPDLLSVTPSGPAWDDVPALIHSFAKLAAAPVVVLRSRLAAAPPYLSAYWHPDLREAHVVVPDEAVKLAEWEAAVGDVDGVDTCTVSTVKPAGLADGDEPWILVKRADDVTRAIAQTANFMPSPVNKFFGGPNPLAATLTGGLLGAGLGYGGGWLAETVLGDKVVDKGRLRKLMALIGGGIGAAPGLWWGSVAHRAHPDEPGFPAWLSSWPNRPEDAERPSDEPVEMPKQGSLVEAVTAARGVYPSAVPSPYFMKAALGAGFGGAFAIDQLPAIPKNNFGQVVWQDQHTPLPIRAATTGLLESASALRGGSPWVTPVDVARIGMGMGSGYLSGMVVGKTLGALAGLTPTAQQSLQRAGTWAGILTNVVPLAFGG